MTVVDHSISEALGERYEPIRLVATGGMGEVWLAVDQVLGREVACKVLKAEYASDAGFRERFVNEARSAARLQHPGIAGVFDFGERDGQRPFLVMELVDGPPLTDLLRREPMPPERARDLVGQVADALGAAHEHGLVHRDVKPGNILICPDGRVKLTDFGIARAADVAALTRTGEIVGTPSYLSPEQAEGRTATAASDVYALGCVLFECLTGQRPFQADGPVATALAHLRQPVPELPGDVPADLAAITRRALAKDPADRYPDGAAFAAALRGDEAGATRVLTLPPTPSAKRGRPAWADRLPVLVMAGLALLLLGALLVNALTGDDVDPAAPPAEPQTVDVVAATYLERRVEVVRVELDRLGLETVVRRTANPGGHVEGTVARVSPTGAQPLGAVIVLTVWDAPAPAPAPAGDDDEDDKGKGNGKPDDKGKSDDGKGKGDG